MNKKVSDNGILTKRTKYKIKRNAGLGKSTNAAFTDISVATLLIFVWYASPAILKLLLLTNTALTIKTNIQKSHSVEKKNRLWIFHGEKSVME
ncbi:MAG: hypothetical protein E2604_14135 [Flavobacterium sp.]|nr:hypothetical protein [Flavobacterium sp.]